MSAAADGERNAIRGYRWQYDQLAARVYSALLDDTFVSLRLTDPEAGKVDDLVLITDTGTIGHQYKSEGGPGRLTLNQLVVARRTRSGRPAPSLVRELAEGWLSLRSTSGQARVELVTNKRASVRDRLADPDEPDPPVSDKFAALLSTVLDPIFAGDLLLADVPSGWQLAMRQLQDAAELNDADFAGFLGAMRIRVGQPDPLQTMDLGKRADIQALSDLLFREVSNSDAVVEFDRAGLLALTGWLARTSPVSSHQFDVDLVTYEPLKSAIDSLDHLLESHVVGYLGLFGPPGSGKSTLLSQALMRQTDHVIRYYAYVPSAGAQRNRLGARGFLHDVVLMLQRSLQTAIGRLLDTDVQQLRKELHHLLLLAAERFVETGERTVVVIDGLDHVERDHPGEGNLLGELPAPSTLGNGVLILVGTRTDSPVSGQIRAQLDDSRVVDLVDHRISNNAVLDICRRAPQTADLDNQLHQLIADMAAGHPLSLAYLLNKVTSLGPGDDVAESLSQLRIYDGDIAATYESIWGSISEAEQDLLALINRLRIPFAMDDLVEWFGVGNAGRFRDKLGYLFRFNGATGTAFHDSFRQFVIVRTNVNGEADPTDALWDANHHAEIASHCAEASRSELRWEELYHHHRSGQELHELVTQELFREQTVNLRSNGTIREDLAIVLQDAATRRDLMTLTTATLAKMEFEGRLSTLEQIDVSGTFVTAGLLEEAVAFAGIDQALQIPLQQAYDLAGALGAAGSPHGQRVFAAIESHGFSDEGRHLVSGREDDIHEAWARASPMYRPIDHITDVLKTFWPNPKDQNEEDFRGYGRGGASLDRFQKMAQHICATLETTGQLDALGQLGDLIREIWESLPSDNHDRGSTHTDDKAVHPDESKGADNTERNEGTLAEIALTIAEIRAQATPDEATSVRILTEAIDLTRNPMFQTSIFRWANIALDVNQLEHAAELLDRNPCDARLTSDELGYSLSISLQARYEYWRAKHRFHRRLHGLKNADVLEAIGPAAPPKGRRPDGAADELTGQIDRSIRLLAAAGAANSEGDPYELGQLMATLTPVLSFGHRKGHTSATYSGIRQNATDLRLLAIDVAAAHGPSSLSRLAEQFGNRFDAQPDDWPPDAKLSFAARFSLHGHLPVWYSDAVAAQEAALPLEDLDLTSRLESVAALVRHHQRLGNGKSAKRLALTLIPQSFAVGYRKDYQFSRWTDLFGAAVEAGLESAIEDSIDLARLLRRAELMTEGAPRRAAASMLRPLGTRHHGHAVALFEYLVRHGAVSHTEALAELVAGLVSATKDEMSIVMAVDILTDIVATVDRSARPDAARAVVAACKRLPAISCDGLLAEMATRFECNPLATTRWRWLDALGIAAARPAEPQESGNNEWGNLRLLDGQTLSKSQVRETITSATEATNLMRQELLESSFDWVPILKHLQLNTERLNTEQLKEWTDQAMRTAGDILPLLGNQWLAAGNVDRALQCASRALELGSGDEWSTSWGTSRLDSHQLAISAGGDAELQRAWDDLALCVGDRPWRGEIILDAIQEIGAMLDSAISPIDLWLLVRTHLKGMTLGIDFDDEIPLENQPIRWWLNADGPHCLRMSSESSVEEAIAAIVIDHAFHPAIPMQEPAIATAANNAKAGGETMALLHRLLETHLPDDITEPLGRIVHFVDPEASTEAKVLHSQLGASDNAYIRQLSSRPDETHLPLPTRYNIVLPSQLDGAILLKPEQKLYPHQERVVSRLAAIANIEEDNLHSHVRAASSTLVADLPAQHVATAALKAANVRVLYSAQAGLAQRSALGHLIQDFESAGRLDGLQGPDRRLFSGFDPALVHLRPESRPRHMPARPPASVAISLSEWIAGTDSRLAEHLAAIGSGEGLVIAASAMTTVLNWGWLQETLTATTVVGHPSVPVDHGAAQPLGVFDRQLSELSEPAPASRLGCGESLAIRNHGIRLSQMDAFWTSFSPTVAAALGWIPDVDKPGTWTTANGDVAVRTIWWADGRPVHSKQAFEDSQGSGTIVWATEAGTNEIRAIGSLTRICAVEREGRSDTVRMSMERRTSVEAQFFSA